MRNYDFGSSPTKSFSAYGVNSNLKNINVHDSSKKEKLSDIDMAIQQAKAFHEKQNAMRAPISKSKTNDFTKLGGEEMTEIVQTNAKEMKPQRKKVTFKTDEEIKQSLDMAKEQNAKIGEKFDTGASTKEILDGVLNDLF